MINSLHPALCAALSYAPARAFVDGFPGVLTPFFFWFPPSFRPFSRISRGQQASFEKGSLSLPYFQFTFLPIPNIVFFSLFTLRLPSYLSLP